MSIPRLLWKDLARPGDVCLIARHTVHGAASSGYHRHDFHEIFWVVGGEGRHRVAGGTVALEPGQCWFIRAADAHRITGTGDRGMTFVNVAVAPGVVEESVRRLGGLMKACYPAGKAIPPVRWLLGADQRGECESALERLVESGRDRFEAELFLHRVVGAAAQERPPGRDMPPDWLALAVERLREREVFAAGVAGFVRVAGRSAEHVAREVRRCLGCTPGDLVTRARITYACSRLEMSSVPITELADECGFQSLSHFIRRFREAQGEPPLRYRRRRWGLTGG